MKGLVAQHQESKRDDDDPDERGEVTAGGEHHGGSFRTYFAHKVTKLREQHQPNLSGDKNTQIFKGCIMYVYGLTGLPMEELCRLISLHGGELTMHRAGKITHNVCNHFTDAQLKREHAKVKLNAKNIVHNVTVVWVLESIRRMKRLDENLYIPKGLKDHGSVSVLTKDDVMETYDLNSGSDLNSLHTMAQLVSITLEVSGAQYSGAIRKIIQLAFMTGFGAEVRQEVGLLRVCVTGDAQNISLLEAMMSRELPGCVIRKVDNSTDAVPSDVRKISKTAVRARRGWLPGFASFGGANVDYLTLSDVKLSSSILLIGWSHTSSECTAPARRWAIWQGLANLPILSLFLSPPKPPVRVIIQVEDDAPVEILISPESADWQDALRKIREGRLIRTVERVEHEGGEERLVSVVAPESAREDDYLLVKFVPISGVMV